MNPEPVVPPFLVFGYGNPSRGDDALGPEFLRSLDAWVSGRPQAATLELLTDFQLQIEHAMDLGGRRAVLFVDASLGCDAPFEFCRLRPERDASYTSHALSPGALLHVYRLLEGAPPPCFLLSIRGYDFALGNPLSRAAERNLRASLRFVRKLILVPDSTGWASSGS